MIILISGIPGAGKTTVARQVAEAYPRSVHIEGDRISHELIVNGLVPPQGPPQDEADRQLLLRRRNIAALAQNFLADGFVVVIDDVVVSRNVFDLYASLLPTRFHFVQLTPSLAAVKERDAGRHKQVFEIWSHLDDQLRSWATQPGVWVDSSHQSAEETAIAVLTSLGEQKL